MKRIVVASVIALLLGVTPSVGAAPISFSGSWDLDLSYPAHGLELDIVRQSPLFGFDLEVGQTTSIDLFTVGTDEDSIELDDWIPYLASVSFDFVLPGDGGSGEVWGIRGGGYFGRKIGEQGYIAWDNPLEIAFTPGGEVLLITLSNEKFGVPTINPPTVRATFTLTSGGNGGSNPPTSVPEPSSLALLGLGFGAVINRARRRINA